MTLRTPDEYLDNLRDDRVVFYRGEYVGAVPDHPELGLAARHAAIDFELAHDPKHKDLAVRDGPDGAYSAYYSLPRSPEDLVDRSRLIELGTRHGGTLVLLIKEIGTDAVFALHRVLAHAGLDEELERLRAMHQRYRDNDLALAVAQTDVKGDRGKSPREQDDPDLHLRVVEETADGVVVRGAKAHTSCAPYVDEIIVLPSRRLGTDEEDWAIGFAVPVATSGLKLYAADFLHGVHHRFNHPVIHRHKMVETLTVFDDVFVPWERVFFHRRTDVASMAALTFVEYHRFTAVSYKLPLLDALVGASIAIAEANGISRASHVRDKLTWLAGYAETVRGLIELAASRAQMDGAIAYPHVFTTNLAKWTFARELHTAMEITQDLAGGLLVTGPAEADWASEEIRPVLDKYLRGAWSADQRMAVVNLIRELTTDLYGGYQAVLAVHAEGSMEAEKLQMYRAYDHQSALAYARDLAGIR